MSVGSHYGEGEGKERKSLHTQDETKCKGRGETIQERVSGGDEVQPMG